MVVFGEYVTFICLYVVLKQKCTIKIIYITRVKCRIIGYNVKIMMGKTSKL